MTGCHFPFFDSQTTSSLERYSDVTLFGDKPKTDLSFFLFYFCIHQLFIKCNKYIGLLLMLNYIAGVKIVLAILLL